MVAELIKVHLPSSLSDDELCRDLCAVLAINLKRIADDIENSAKAWDKKAYHSKADELRRDNVWASEAAVLAENLAYRAQKFGAGDLLRLQTLIPQNLELLQRPRFKDLAAVRGAAAAARKTVLKPR